MTFDPLVVPGFLFLLAELVALAGVGYVIVRVALRETDQRVALAQGLVVGPAIWGVVVNLVMYALPGMPGGIAGWIIVLALAVVLTWRSPEPVRPRLRTAALFTTAALALFWVALASRQMLGISDVHIHLGLAASIRAGTFPPELPWAGLPVPYHYGPDMLAGLLMPPSGPDLAFTDELLGSFAWISLFLVVLTALLRRASGLIVSITVPLLLSAGLWTFGGAHGGILAAPALVEIPSAGFRASLVNIYWPPMELVQDWLTAPLPNIYKQAFTLSYALMLIVLMHAASDRRRSWPKVITLAALIGLLGLISTSVVPIAFILWAGLEAIHFLRSRRVGSLRYGDVVRSASGLALALLLLLAGGFSTIILGDSGSSVLSIEWRGMAGWGLVGTLHQLPGGVALLVPGSLAVAGVAVLLARRDRLVWALAAGAGLLILTGLLLDYEPNPADLIRLAGHARNFALYALLLALAVRLAALRPERWRYAAGALVAVLIVWPTISAPVRYLGQALHRGVELINAHDAPQPHGTRYALMPIPSDRIAAYIRDHTAADSRVFSPHPHEMTFNTGRPSASALAGLVTLGPTRGPTYRDVLRHLEPAAISRLGFKYIHATDSWVAELPDEATARLNDPRLFELLVREGPESLYRVLPALLSLDPPPAQTSYEALRRAVPASAMVYPLIPRKSDPRPSVLTAWALSHARLLGEISRNELHLVTPLPTEPLGDRVPDLVITPAQFTPWMFPAASRRPIWWNDKTAVYALDGAVDPIMPPPPWSEPLPFRVEVSDVSEANGRITFAATFDDGAPDQWTSQDWVLVATGPPPWNFPDQVLHNSSSAITTWFVSYLNPGRGTTSLVHEFDFHAPSLAVQRERGVFKPLERSEGALESGRYLLAVRLRHEYKQNQWRDAAIIPVLKITVSGTGEVSYEVHEDVRG
ncbi:MAG: hypothetical protein OXG46_02100 [Chloroflexi bacterium]|nr:hypothetical protein [Chloroflexota bacterium]MCY3937829.1 hypothetical protein [Chloroflexota bacterium]